MLLLRENFIAHEIASHQGMADVPTIPVATKNVAGCPVTCAVTFENLVNQEVDLAGVMAIPLAGRNCAEDREWRRAGLSGNW